MEMGFNESLSRGQVCVYWEKEKIIITVRNKIIIIVVPFFFFILNSNIARAVDGQRGKKNNQPKRAYNCVENNIMYILYSYYNNIGVLQSINIYII